MVVTIIYRPKLIDTFLIEEAGKWVWAVFDLKDFDLITKELNPTALNY